MRFCWRAILTATLLFVATIGQADQLIIEPEMGRAPIIDAINRTQHSIHLIIYGFTDNTLFNAINQQKQRGRSVSIILEKSPYKAPDENSKIMAQLNAAHINWQSNIPSFRFIHQKTLLIDGREALVMTFNFTKSTFKRQRNFALLVNDPQKVKEIEAVFSADWNHKIALHHSPDLFYSPDDSRNKLIKLINSAQHSIKIYAQTISDYQVVGALANAARRGIHVAILTSSSLQTKQVNYLTKAGVNIHQSSGLYIHAKAFIIDDKVALIGSINLTRASLNDNRELSVMTRDAFIAKQMATTFNVDWQS